MVPYVRQSDKTGARRVAPDPARCRHNALMSASSWRSTRFGLATVRGVSMRPTLRDGDLLLVWYAGGPRLPLAPGRLVLVELPPDADGVPRPVAVKRLTGPAPDGEPGWWVERDNPREGVDSWTVGAIGDEHVVALVLARVWPPRLPRPRRPERLTRRQRDEAE